LGASITQFMDMVVDSDAGDVEEVSSVGHWKQDGRTWNRKLH